MLKAIIRWHRTHRPRQSDRFVGRLTDSDFYKAQWLTALVRIADGADAGKSDAVDSLSVSINPDVLYIRVSSSQDCELEMYSARRKRALLESVADRDVIIEEAHTALQEQD